MAEGFGVGQRRETWEVCQENFKGVEGGGNVMDVLLLSKAVVISMFLIGIIIIVTCWIGSIISSFKENEPGWGFFALGGLLIALAWLISQFIPCN